MPDPQLKVLVAVGTRPEAIKMVPVIRALTDSEYFEPFIVSTGQHPGLVEGVLGLAGYTPDIDLHVARPGLTLNQLFSSVVGDLEIALTERFGPPDSSLTSGRDSSYPVVALVHGDTSSAAAVAYSVVVLPSEPGGALDAGAKGLTMGTRRGSAVASPATPWLLRTPSARFPSNRSPSTKVSVRSRRLGRRRTSAPR